MIRNANSRHYYIPSFLNSNTKINLSITIAYIIVGLLTRFIFVLDINLYPFFPAIGLGATAVMIFGRKAILGIAMGCFLFSLEIFKSTFINATSFEDFLEPIFICFCRAVIASLNGFTIYYINKLWCRNRYPFDRGMHVLYFALACIIGSIISVSIGIIPLSFTSYIPKGEFILMWSNWFRGNALGAMLFAPFALSCLYKNNKKTKWSLLKGTETIALLITTVIASLYIFESRANNTSLTFLLILWASYRFGVTVISLVFLIITCISIHCTGHNEGGFVYSGWNSDFFLLQLFLYLSTVSALFLKAILNEKEIEKSKLKVSEQKLNFQKNVLEAIIASPNGISIYSLDKKLNYLTFNSAHSCNMREMYGVEIKKGANLIEYIQDPEMKQKDKEIFFSVLKGNIHHEEYKNHKGEFWDIIISPIKDKENKIIGITTVSANVTTLRLSKLELEKNNYDLNERIKELTCLYNIFEINNNNNLSTTQLISSCIEIVRSGFQFPEITNCRITVQNQESIAVSDKETNWFLHKIILVNGVAYGAVEVGYLEENQFGNTFLNEEVKLLDAIANILSHSLERNLAEENLKISEEKFRAIYESFDDIYFKRDLEGTLFDVSPSVEKHFNIKSEDVIGQNANDFYVDYADGERFYQTVLQNQQVNDYEECFVTGNGEIIYFSVNAKVIYDSNGEPTYIEGTMRNVNERIQNRKKLLEATEKIKESEEKFRSIYENSLDIYFRKDLDGILLEIGPSVEKHLHRTQEFMIGKNIKDFYYDPTYGDRFYEIILKEKQIYDFEEQFVTPTGELVYFSVNAKLIYDSDGNPLFVEGTKRNISERIHNEKQLLQVNDKIKESEEKFRSIYENSLDIYFKKDLDGLILEIGPSVDKHLYQTKESMIGKNIRDYYYDIADVDLFYEIILKEKQIIDYQERFITATGDSVYLSVNAKLVYDAEGKPLYVEGTRRNISERILNEQHLLEATEKIKESEEKYRSIFENTQDVYYMHNLDGRIFEVSPSCEKHFKYTREEMIGMFTGDLYYDSSKQNEFREKITKKGYINDEHVQFVTATGEPIYFSVTCKIIFDQSGIPSHIEGSMRNINERILNQQQLVVAAEKIKESEEKFRSIYENMHDVYFKQELDGTLIDISPSAEKNFPTKRENLIGLNARSFYTDPARFDELTAKALENGYINDQEVQFLTTTGEIAYFSLSARIINDEKDNRTLVEGTMRNINERVSNQKQLLEASAKIKESEEKFRTVYENLIDVYFMKDLDGTILNISPSVESYFHLKPEFVIGKNCFDFYYNRADGEKLNQIIIEKKQINDYEERYVTPEGEIIYFSVNAKLRYDSNGEPAFIEGTMRNVNERINNQKQLLEASEKIKESEEKFRSIFENMEDVYYLHNIDGTLLNTSPSAEKYFNIKREDLIGDKVQKLFTNPLRYDELTEITLREGFINDKEVEFMSPSGETMYFSVNSKLINDSNGVPILAEGTMRNISERINNQKQLLNANEKIKKSEEKFRSIFENMQDIYYMHTLDGKIFEISPSFEKHFNYKRDKIIGTYTKDLHYDPSKQEELKKILIRDGSLNDQEALLLTANNEPVFFSVNCRIVYDENGLATHVEGSMRNINERIHNEKQLLNVTEKIKESEEKFRSLFDNMQDIYFMHTLEGKIFEISPAVEKHLKYKREEMIGTYSKDHFYNPSQQLEIRKKLIDNGYINDHEIQYVTATGEALYFSLNSRIKFNPDGTPSHIEGSIRNINDRILNQNKLLEASEKIKRSEEEFRSIFESFEDLYFRTNLEGYIQNVSPSIEKIFKYKREEIIGSTTAILYSHPEDRSKVIDALNEKGHITDFETIFKDKDNKILYVSMNAHFIYDSNEIATHIEGTIRDISERKKNELEIEKANDAIRKSEEEFRSIFESFEDVYFRSSLDGCVKNISPSVEKIFKYKREEFIGTISNILYYYPEDSEKVMTALNEKGYIKDFETIFKDKENKIIYVSLNIHLTYDSKGNAMHIEGIIRDISERKKNELEIETANEVIRESEKKYRTIFESVRDVFFRASALDHTILDISPSCSYFDVQPEDIIGKQIEGFYLNPEDRQDVLKELMQNGEIKNYDAKFLINSKVYNVSINSKVVFNENNEPEFVIGSFRDITARIQAEENLKISEAKFRSIYENFEDVYYKTELDGTVIDLSPSFERNFKMKRNDVLGTATSFSYYNPEDRQAMLELLKNNGRISDFDTRYIDGEGNTVAISINARTVSDSNGNPIYVEGTMRNINERSTMQEEMLAKNRTLEFQNTELEQFAYIASHDLQEPLITVIHCVELLQEGLYENLDDEKKQYLEFINSSTSRMQQLVKGLLDYSRIGKGRKSNQIDCNEIVANVLADMDVSLKESNAIIECENLPIIQGYTTEIRQLFQNIISNASKFRKKEQQPKIKIKAAKEENNWIFSIEDNGIGIKEEDMDKVFVIFKRLHNRSEYKGTGIGLSHCKKIVEHHNGAIWVESKYNEGSTFKWTFPIELN